MLPQEPLGLHHPSQHPAPLPASAPGGRAGYKGRACTQEAQTLAIWEPGTSADVEVWPGITSAGWGSSLVLATRERSLARPSFKRSWEPWSAWHMMLPTPQNYPEEHVLAPPWRAPHSRERAFSNPVTDSLRARLRSRKWDASLCTCVRKMRATKWQQAEFQHLEKQALASSTAVRKVAAWSGPGHSTTLRGQASV